MAIIWIRMVNRATEQLRRLDSNGFVENMLLDSVKAFQEHNTLWILKESRYVRLVNTIYRVLRNSRMPLFLHNKSNHVFTVWQHIVLLTLTIRQYEGKSYRIFVKWLVEAYYLRAFLQLPRIPHFTTLQKLHSESIVQHLER